MADVEDHATGHEVDGSVTFGVSGRQRREVIPSDHSLHTGHALSNRSVDRHDAGVTVGRSQEHPVQLAREVEVGGEAGLTHYLVVAVVTDGSGSNPLVSRAILGHGHRDAPLSCTAASWTERTILS